MLTLEIGSFEAWRFWFRFAVSALQSHKCDEVRMRGQRRNHDGLLEHLMEPIARQARQRAADMIRDAASRP
jgi:hypothetical protein